MCWRSSRRHLACVTSSISIAVKAANDLFEQEATRLIALIASRKQEIEALMKMMGLATDGLRKSESDLKFETIIESVEAVEGDYRRAQASCGRISPTRRRRSLDKAIAAAETANDIQKLIKEFKTPSVLSKA